MYTYAMRKVELVEIMKIFLLHFLHDWKSLNKYTTIQCHCRVIEGGEKEMMALDIEASGELFVSGGEDALVKVKYTV